MAEAGDDPLSRVRAEIDAEVERRRRSGELPAELEAELDRLFAQFAPVAAAAPDPAREALALVDAGAAFDGDVPLGSGLPGGGVVKRLVHRLVGWYVGFFVAQLTRFDRAVTRALHVLVDEVDRLRARVEDTDAPAVGPGVSGAPEAPPTGGWWWEAAAAALAGAGPGRVLVAECGEGQLLELLARRGIDAYGVDRHEAAVSAAAAAGHDVRNASLVEHLELVGDGRLAGVVVEAAAEPGTARHRDRLLELLRTRTRPGAVVVVASWTPGAWERSRSPVLADLGAGRPLHAETWSALLDAAGFDPRDLHRGGPDRRIPVAAATGDGDDRLGAVVAAVNDLLGGPDQYAAVAVRRP